MKIEDHIKQSQFIINKARIVLKTADFCKSLLTMTTSRDGSLIVDTASCVTFDNWRYGYYNIPRGPFANITIPIETNTLVNTDKIGPKFTYHKSGWVVVGRERLPDLRIEATKFEETNGHLFTIMAKGFCSFKDTDLSNKKYFYVGPLIKNPLERIKIVAYAGKLEDFITVKDDIVIPANTPSIRFVRNIDGQEIECSFFRIILYNKYPVWIKLEYWLDFAPTANKEPSLHALVGWKQEAQDINNPFRMIGILGGADW